MTDHGALGAVRFAAPLIVALLAVVPARAAETPVSLRPPDHAAPAVAVADATPATPAVTLRAGEHASFSRLVFDWAVPVDYTVDNQDGHIRIGFDRPAALDAGRVTRRPPKGVSALQASRDENGRPQLSFAAEGRVRHFRDGTKIVVDVMRPRPQRAAPDAGDASVAPPAPVAAPASEKAVATAAPAAKPAPKPAAAATAEPAAGPVGPSAAAAATPAVSAVKGAAAGTPQPRAPQPAAAAALPVAPPVTGSAADPAARAAAPSVIEPVGVTGAPLDVEVEAETDGVRMTFAFDEPVAAAAFRRGGHMWLVFDRATRIDTERLTEEAGRFARRIEQIGHRDATVLRILTGPGYNPSIASDGARWNVFLAPQTLKPDTPLDVRLPPSRDAALAITTATAGSTLTLPDPEVGDVFFVVPVKESAHGVETAHDYVDLRILPTVQGVAVSAFSERVDVRGRPDGVSITAIGGLRLTSPADRARLLEVAAVAGPPDAFFDFRGWQRTAEGDFDAVRRTLIERLLEARAKDRNLARLDLARFYFAYGLADRARGVLAQIVREAPEIERSPAFRALRGAAAVLMDDFAAAREDLGDRGLDQEAEVEVWRAAVLAGAGDWSGAAFGFQQAERFVSAYPTALRARFGLTGARAALAIDDLHMAKFWNEFLKATRLTAAQAERRRLVEAEIAAAEGDAEKALGLFDRIIAGNDRYSRAHAALDRVELMLDDGRMSPSEAVAALDRQRYVWRGDDLEFDVLHRLGQLQIETARYRDGLRTLKRAVTSFADEPFTPAVTEEMRATFRRLYFDGAADALPAVTAIALFNEFRELAPAGSEGDEMIRRLADRMITVDLLDKAAELLAHQVEFRLEGAEKARIGTRLAIVRLLDRKPEAALEALDDSRVADMPRELARERQLVGARAWAETGDKARALALIAEDRAPDAERLRAEIMWRAEDWAGAAAVLRRLAGPAPDPDRPLSEQRARYVLNGAVALVLAGDLDGLARLRRAFGTAMEETMLGADFRVIVAADRTARDFGDVVQRISTVDDFDAFMKSYRARLLEPQNVTAAGARETAG